MNMFAADSDSTHSLLLRWHVSLMMTHHDVHAPYLGHMKGDIQASWAWDSFLCPSPLSERDSFPWLTAFLQCPCPERDSLLRCLTVYSSSCVRGWQGYVDVMCRSLSPQDHASVTTLTCSSAQTSPTQQHRRRVWKTLMYCWHLKPPFFCLIFKLSLTNTSQPLGKAVNLVGPWAQNTKHVLSAGPKQEALSKYSTYKCLSQKEGRAFQFTVCQQHFSILVFIPANSLVCFLLLYSFEEQSDIHSALLRWSINSPLRREG